MFQIFIILSIFLTFFLDAQDFDLAFPAATQKARDKYKAEMQKSISTEIFSFKSKKDEGGVKKSFEYMQILNYLEDDGYNFLKYALMEYPVKSENFYSSALETIFALYKTGFESEMENVLQSATNTRHFTIAVHFLQRVFPEERLNYLKILQTRFKNYEKNPSLKALANFLNVSPSEYLARRPPLKDIFSHDFGENNFILFSLQRLNRDYPGLGIIKKPDGTFLRREDGSIFTISQLARSVSNLPSYVVNGNTPQGIFSIQKTQVLKNDVIGPTPALITALPFEVTRDIFFHLPSKNGKWSLKTYLDILPSSWKEYYPMQEAYIAGETGRNVIYAHGTTVDTEFYRDYVYYPNTPTRGCLSSKEIWSRKNGKCLYSDQVFLVNAVKSLESASGYMIVIDLDEKELPVSLDEVLMDILEVEENKN